MGTTLLFGLPRSGTTWLGKIFDSHPSTLYRHEPDSRSALSLLPLLTTAEDDADVAPALAAFADALWARTEERVVDSVPVFPKSYLPAHVHAIRRAVLLARKLAPSAFGAYPSARFYAGLRTRDVHLVWKSIESLGRIGTFARLLPAARAIFILRHPGGFVASTLRGERRGKFVDAYRPADDLPLFRQLVESRAGRTAGVSMDDVTAMAPVERLALRWSLICQNALDDVVGLATVKVIRYEDVCAAPEPQARGLFEFAGLPWSEQTERFVRHSTSNERSGYYSVVKDPLKSAMNWQTELSADDIERLYAVAGRFTVGGFYPR